jgi:hemerythrin
VSSTVAFEWTDAYLLGFRPMDDTHREFVALVDAMLVAGDEAMAELVTAFESHAEAHFDQEARWMRETSFPAMDCHVDEHDRVLKSAREVRELVVRGDTAVARRFAAELKKWFPGHADYLDSALAQWIVKKRCGGVPVVVKRDLVCAG